MTVKRTLIIDDEPDIRELLEITLGRMGVETRAAESYREALTLLADDTFDLCLTDMQLPDGNGLNIIEHISEHYPDLPVAMITAFGSMDTAISALKAGAFDFVQKPIELEQLRAIVDNALRMTETSPDRASVSLLGDSVAINTLRTQIKKLSRSQAPIYVSGESGSGKEVAARLIHSMGPRGEGPFIPVNCGAIPSELMESEFFGHLKGSFTGATNDKVGLFQAAAGGTLFLDEVADLPLSMQVKLLRAIQEKAVRPVGSQNEDKTDVRILSATHKDLAAEVDAGNFRQDLFYRLNVIELTIPALRDHPEDIEQLANAALARLAQEYGGEPPVLSAAAQTALQAHPFPGNVRELENILERAFTLCEGEQIKVEDLQLGPQTASAGSLSAEPSATQHATTPPPADSIGEWQIPPGHNLESYLEQIERTLISDALEATRWNKTAAAKELGVTFRALRYKLKKLEME